MKLLKLNELTKKKLDDTYIVNGKIICRKMAKKIVVFPTFFCIKNSMI